MAERERQRSKETKKTKNEEKSGKGKRTIYFSKIDRIHPRPALCNFTAEKKEDMHSFVKQVGKEEGRKEQ